MKLTFRKLLCTAAAVLLLMTGASVTAFADTDNIDAELYSDLYVDGVDDVTLTTEADPNDSASKLIPQENYENRYEPDTRLKDRLVDEADLLTDSQEAELKSKLDSISEKYGMDVAVVTAQNTGWRTATEFADDYYDYNGFAKDGIVLLIAMENRDWAISTKGEGIPDFTDRGQEYMVDQFKPYLSNGDYNKAFLTYADLCDDFINEARTKQPYDYNHMPKGPFRLIWVGVGIVVGLIAALIVCSKNKSELLSVGMQHNADTYFVQDSFRLTQQQDSFLYTKTDKRYIQPDSDRGGGGGGSSTHTSSSGSSHGGSSGHF